MTLINVLLEDDAVCAPALFSYSKSVLSAAVELPDSVIETLLEKRHKPNRTRLLVNFTFRRRESPLVLVNTKLFRSFSEVLFFVFESRNSKISVSISLIHSPFIAGIFFFFRPRLVNHLILRTS